MAEPGVAPRRHTIDVPHEPLRCDRVGPVPAIAAALAALTLATLLLALAPAPRAQAATHLGQRALKLPMEGRDVRQLQHALRGMGLLHAPATGHYGTLTRTAVRRYQRRHCLKADGIAGPLTVAAILGRRPRCGATPARQRAGAPPPAAPEAGMHARVATWYGPGLYGRSTACGQILDSHLLGVAHRTLPCGTRVRFVLGGRSVVATVVDRGPYGAGIDYDLTWAAARRLGILAIGRATVQADH